MPSEHHATEMHKLPSGNVMQWVAISAHSLIPRELATASL